MIGRTHFVGGLIAGAASSFVFPANPIATGIVGGISALIPDIDHPRATASQYAPIVSSLMSRLRHRGPTHSFLAVVIFSFLIAMIFYGVSISYFYAAIFGYLSHIILDMMTVEGAMILWPFSYRFFALPVFLIKTGSAVESWYRYGGILLFLILVTKYGQYY